MILAIVLFFVVMLVVLGFGIKYAFAKRRHILDAMRQGLAEGTAYPGSENMPRGAGGYNAAQTTSMANRALEAMGKPKLTFLTPDIGSPKTPNE
jgi:hypothetical protein